MKPLTYTLPISDRMFSYTFLRLWYSSIRKVAPGQAHNCDRTSDNGHEVFLAVPSVYSDFGNPLYSLRAYTLDIRDR